MLSRDISEASNPAACVATYILFLKKLEFKCVKVVIIRALIISLLMLAVIIP
jgi:hypothetical protein